MTAAMAIVVLWSQPLAIQWTQCDNLNEHDPEHPPSTEQKLLQMEKRLISSPAIFQKVILVFDEPSAMRVQRPHMFWDISKNLEFRRETEEDKIEILQRLYKLRWVVPQEDEDTFFTGHF